MGFVNSVSYLLYDLLTVKLTININDFIKSAIEYLSITLLYPKKQNRLHKILNSTSRLTIYILS